MALEQSINFASAVKMAHAVRMTNAVKMSDTSLILQPHQAFPRCNKLAVIILDGWGESEPSQYNAIHLADTPTMDALKKEAPNRWRLIMAHGPWVGLPNDDDMGNSEVGHNALGAGRIFKQGAGLVDTALESGKLFHGDGFKYIKDSFLHGTLHLIGLLSDGGVHSRYDQLQALLKGCADHGAKRIRVHILTDGRDVSDGSSFNYVEHLESDLNELRKKGVDALIASGGGRMRVTMDRYENDWNVVENGWKSHVLGEAEHKFTSALQALEELRANDPNVNDQYYPPFVIVDEQGHPVGSVKDGDSVVTFNFRADRMVMISKALEYEDFDAFDRVRYPEIRFAGMMQYDGELKLPSHFLVPPPEIERTSGEFLVANGIRTYACRSGRLNDELEYYDEIPSDQGIPFNIKPEMQALKIAEKACEALRSGNFDQVRINFANADMVGHTGDLNAAIKACSEVDKAVKMVLDAVDEAGGIFLITADHGNAEMMVKCDLKTGKPIKTKDGKLQTLTSHTTSQVPFTVGGPGLIKSAKLKPDMESAGLANVAATIINLLGFMQPLDYEPSLLTTVEEIAIHRVEADEDRIHE